MTATQHRLPKQLDAVLFEHAIRLRIPPSKEEQLLQVPAMLDISFLLSQAPLEARVFAANLTFDDATGVQIENWDVYDQGTLVVGRNPDGLALTIEATRFFTGPAEIPEAAVIAGGGDKRLRVAIPTIVRNWYRHQQRLNKLLNDEPVSIASWNQNWTNGELAAH